MLHSPCSTRAHRALPGKPECADASPPPTPPTPCSPQKLRRTPAPHRVYARTVCSARPTLRRHHPPETHPPTPSHCHHCSHLSTRPPSPRMMRPVHRLQPPQRHVRIHLRRRDIRMPQQRLHAAQVRLHAPPCASRSCAAVYAGSPPRPHSNPAPSPTPTAASAQPPPDTQKHLPPDALPHPHQPRPPPLKISLHRLAGRAPQRHNPLLIALPPHLRPLHVSAAHPPSRSPQISPTRSPPPYSILQNRQVPQSNRCRHRPRRRPLHRPGGPLQHPFHFTLRQRPSAAPSSSPASPHSPWGHAQSVHPSAATDRTPAARSAPAPNFAATPHDSPAAPP